MLDQDPSSNMRLTGWNALIALGITIFLLVAICTVYGFLYLLGSMISGNDVSIWKFPSYVATVIQGLGWCFGPMIFIPSFALLQRFRIK